MTLYNFANITKLWGELNKINLLSLVGRSHVTMTELINQSMLKMTLIYFDTHLLYGSIP